MKVLRGVTWIWWCIIMIMMMGVMSSSLAMEEVESKAEKNQKFQTVTYDLNTGQKGYTNFLTNFRNAVATNKDKICNILTLPREQSFIYVELKESTRTITVALQTTDLYVLGYSDGLVVDGKIRARFFLEIKKTIMDQVFGNNYDKVNSKVKENYNDLVRETRFDRNKLILKVSTIKEVFDEVYRKSVADLEKKDPKNGGRPENNFFFVMCQMISEATRFKIMETAITSKDGTLPKSIQLKEFQNNWNTAAKLIQATVPRCERLQTALTIDGTQYNTVDSLRKKIAVVKFQEQNSVPLASIINNAHPL